MNPPGVRHAGFTIPFYITQKYGARWREPGRGVCSECEEHKDHVYMTWDDKPYCRDCMMFDLAEANPSDEIKREQRHPPTYPIETVYEKVKYAVADGADLRVYEREVS
jgi:hypothetical protein